MNFEQYLDAKKRQGILFQNEKYQITDFCEFQSNENSNEINEREGVKGEEINVLKLYDTMICMYFSGFTSTFVGKV